MMEPVFIFFDELEFNERNRFTLKFSNDEENEATNYILFSKNKDYFITSMKCYSKIEGKIKDLSNYGKIKETSYIANDIIDNNIDHLYRFNRVYYIIDKRVFENKKLPFEIIKSQRKKHTGKLTFYDIKTNTEKEIDVYSTFDELKATALNFKNDLVREYVTSLSKDEKKLKKDVLGI